MISKSTMKRFQLSSTSGLPHTGRNRQNGKRTMHGCDDRHFVALSVICR